jgi:Tol biopolymer transport system component
VVEGWHGCRVLRLDRVGRQEPDSPSTESVGKSPTARLDAPWSLYTVDADLTNPIAVLDGVTDPTDLSWSPDGRWLAFVGTLRDARGLWLFDPAKDQLLLLSTEAGLVAFTWSPDGEEIAATRRDEPILDRKYSLLIFMSRT